MDALSAAERLQFSRVRSFKECLQYALKLRYAKRGSVNFADFSRRAGFSSRSFLSELMSGRKGLSRDSLARIKTALKLPKDGARLLECLAYEQYPDLRPDQLSSKTLDRELQLVRERLRAPVVPPLTNKDVIKKPELFQVYAALGSNARGASVAQIVGRTRIAAEHVETCLEFMLANEIVTTNGGRYFATSNQRDIFGLKSKEGLADLVDTVCGTIRMQRRTMIDDQRNAVFYTSFSLNSAQLARVKEKIHEAVYAVLDEMQDDEGDSVAQLFFALWGNGA